jgi:hypothetical protein
MELVDAVLRLAVHDALTGRAHWHCASDFADAVLDAMASAKPWDLLVESRAEAERRENAAWQARNVIELRP